MNLLNPRKFAVALLALTGCLPALADEAITTNQDDFGKADGATVYRHVCQACHMADGKGASEVGHYPGFADNPAVASAQYVAITVIQGRRNMPAFGLGTGHADAMRSVSLTDAQIAGVTNYVRSHFGNHATDTLSAADVASLRDSLTPAAGHGKTP